METISYKLENFEGPLDLLLHLIEKNKVNIYDIPIVEITAQYLDYVRHMEREDLNVVSEFLVMAATLLDIKAKMLLPKELDEEGEEIDPRAELVQRLLEYKRYKLMADELADREDGALKHLYKSTTLPPEVARYEPPVDLDKLLDGVTLGRLEAVFQMVMKKQADKIDPVRSKFGKIVNEPMKVSDKIRQVLLVCRDRTQFSFCELLMSQRDRFEVVVTFLAVLEFIKVGRIGIRQETLFGDIVIEVSESDGPETFTEADLEFA